MKILVVDDDRVLADLIAFSLRREQFQVIQAHDGAKAWALWQKEQPDFVVLDVNLPEMTGFEVCRRIRKEADTPIILLTVRAEEDDIIQGLGFGADDYMLKPFSPRQLVARIQAILRRVGKTSTASMQQVGQLILDPSRREVRYGNGNVISLTSLESRMLAYLVLNEGQMLTNDALIDHVWGAQGADSDMLRQLIRRLRAKLAQTYAHDTPHNFIENISGLGYGLKLPETVE